MEEQQRASEFVAAHDLQAPPEFRLLAAVSELGELAKDAAESTDYGADPGSLDVEAEEVGDALFSLLALADGLDVDAGEALEAALAKDERRIEEGGTPGS